MNTKNYELVNNEIADYNRIRGFNSNSPVCFAPESSLYFGIGGAVTSCCVNRTHVLGKYPEQSIDEIWFGHRRTELQKKVCSGDLSSGCQVCIDGIKSGSLSGLTARQYDKFPKAGKYPQKIDFELSNRCNLECIMCRGERSSSIRKNREGLPEIKVPYDAEFVDQLEPYLLEMKEGHFLGGEPFLIPIYIDIWERMISVQSKAKISIQTNATILTDRIKKILEMMPFSIAVSIDSIDSKLFAEIRKNGNLEKVKKNIDYLNDYCKRKGTNFSLSYTPMTNNWDELPQVVEYCNYNDIKLFFNTLSYPKYLAIQSLKKEEIKLVVSELNKFEPPMLTDIEKENAQAYLSFVKLVEFWRGNASDSREVHLYKSMDDYFLELEKYMRDQEIDADIIGIRIKVERILTRMEDLGRYEKAQEFIFGISFDKIVRYVPSLSDEELFTALNSEVIAL